MAAYLIVDTLLNNPDLYEEYKKKARPLIGKFGGEYLAGGGRMTLRDYSYQMAGELLGNPNEAMRGALALGTFFLMMAALGALTMYWLDYVSILDHRRILGKYWVGGTIVGMIFLALLRRAGRSKSA